MYVCVRLCVKDWYTVTLETKLFGMGRCMSVCVCGGGAEVMGQVSDGMLKRGSSPDMNMSYLIVFGR